jgi:hypothetical protein
MESLFDLVEYLLTMSTSDLRRDLFVPASKSTLSELGESAV